MVEDEISSKISSTGTLYLVATPIGNLEDITLRALRILKEVDLIACEDTRRTAKLLTHYAITTPRESHHQHNEAQSTHRLMQLLHSGKQIALVTDAGMPLVSDPGYRLVAACLQEGIPVCPVPGPSAVTTALASCGLPGDNFYFAGFLPATRGQRRRKLEELAHITCTLIFYEAPHRILNCLEDVAAILGPRRACLARELTKLHEEFIRGTTLEILEVLKSRPSVQGEITLVIEGGQPEPLGTAFPESIVQHLDEEMRKGGVSRQEALKSVARQRGISRKQAYALLLKEKESR
jgi:16S rRNA (cytidine1402-2'-O)-methyltransferase